MRSVEVGAVSIATITRTKNSESDDLQGSRGVDKKSNPKGRDYRYLGVGAAVGRFPPTSLILTG